MRWSLELQGAAECREDQRCRVHGVPPVERCLDTAPSDGRYKLGGDTAGAFWHMIGLCRIEPGELDPYLDKPPRIRDDEPLLPSS